MNTEIWVAIIGCFGVCLTAILTTIVQIRKLRNEQEKTITDSLNANRDEYLKGITEVKDSVTEINLCLASLQASMQNQWALTDLRLQHLTDEFGDMKTEVREHNNFAKRMPVLEEKMDVANHRIADLEKMCDDGK